MKDLIRSRNFLIGAGFVLSLAALVACQTMLDHGSAAQAQSQQAPRYVVDPLWPKPLPNHWVLGMTIGVAVDADDHIWIIHRGAPTLSVHEKQIDNNAGDCCTAAPPVLEFDQAGLRMAGLKPRDFYRLQGQRLDRRQWGAGLRNLEIHERWQIPAASGQEGRTPGSGSGCGER